MQASGKFKTIDTIFIYEPKLGRKATLENNKKKNKKETKPSEMGVEL